MREENGAVAACDLLERIETRPHEAGSSGAAADRTGARG
jgi:hypothetical protein